MKKLTLFFVSVLMLIPLSDVLAWGQKGHRIIAQIAYDNLTPTAKERVDKFLGVKGIVYWSNWADEVKSDEKYKGFYDWHYQNLDPGFTDEEIAQLANNYKLRSGRLWKVTDSLIVELHKDPYKIDDIRFLIHLVGDGFCPMHLGHQDDLGGNKVHIKWFYQNKNLHSIWDGTLIDALGYSYSEYAEYLENTLSSEKSKIEKMTKEEIAIHNYRTTEAIYDYQDVWDGNTYHYTYHFNNILNWQLYACGIRLAQIINDIYK